MQRYESEMKLHEIMMIQASMGIGQVGLQGSMA